MKQIIIFILSSILYSCTNTVYLNKINKPDQEYIKAKIHNDLKCISYDWDGTKNTKVYITFEISPRGNVNAVQVKSELDSNKIIKSILNHYNDTDNYFSKLQGSRNIIYSILYDYSP